MTERFNPDQSLVSEALSELRAYEEKQSRQRDSDHSKEYWQRRALESFREQTKGKMGVLMDEIKQRGINGHWSFDDHPNFPGYAVTLTTPNWVIIASRASVRSLRNPDTLQLVSNEFRGLYSLLGGQYFFPFFHQD